MRPSERICKLDSFITESNFKSIELIKNQLFKALSGAQSFDSKSLFEDYVYQDCDPLERIEDIEDGDTLWYEVRDIQKAIVEEYGCYLLW